LPGIALDRPFVVGMKKLRQLLAQAFVALGPVPAHHRLLEQAVLKLLRQLAPKIQRREPERRREPFDVFVSAHAANKSASDRRGQPGRASLGVRSAVVSRLEKACSGRGGGETRVWWHFVRKNARY
jgi:hypothetical protein